MLLLLIGNFNRICFGLSHYGHNSTRSIFELYLLLQVNSKPLQTSMPTPVFELRTALDATAQLIKYR